MRRALLVASSLTCLAAAHGAAAAAEGARPDTQVTEVVVTAEKTSQSVQKAPLSVTVLDQAKIEQMGATSFADYAVTVPALSFEALGPGENTILLRGVSDGVGTDLRGATQKTTGVYIDDMVVSNNFTSPDLNLFDVNRIEVLKGPQGTLYGDGSVGGLVRVITNKPNLAAFAADVEGTAGGVNHGGGTYEANGMVNIPLVDGKLGLRLVGQYAKADGFIDDVVRNLKGVNTLDQSGFRGALKWAPTDKIDVTFSALTQHTKLGGENDYNVRLGDLKRGTFFGEPKDTRFNLYNATANWDLGWATLVSSTSYDQFRRLDQNDFSDFIGTIFGAPIPSISHQSQNSHAVSQEFRLSSPADQKFRWLTGLYYFRAQEHVTENDVVTGATALFQLAGTPADVGPDSIFVSRSEAVHREYAGFGEATYDLTNRISGTVGLRWFSDRLSSVVDTGGFVTGGPPAHLLKATTDSGTALKFRLADQLDEDALVYATASQGYRIGGLNPLSPATINNPNFPASFGPDTLWNYELGWKTRWDERRLTFNGAAYYVDWQNIQVQHALPSGFSAIQNAGSAHILGLEADAAFHVTSALEVGASGSLIQAQLAQDAPALGGQKGDQLLGVPKGQGSVYAQLKFPVSGDIQGFFRFDAQYAAKMRRYFDSDPVNAGRDVYGDYTLLNLRGGVVRDTLKLTLFVKNLADTRAAFFRGTQATLNPTGRQDIYVAQPRTIGVTVDKQF